MANVTVAGASYTAVPAVELPKTGGGTATFYEADFKTVTMNLTDVSSSADDTRVENGSSFFTKLAPIPNNYVISSITVMMNGVDVTSQVFHPDDGGGGGSTLGTKSISANGTYNASSDNLDGYSQVTVAVPNSYSSSDEGKVVSSGALVSQTSSSTSTNGTVDTTTINSLTVSVPTGTARTSADLTVSGATVTAPAGLYASNATYTMPTAEPYLNSTAEYYTDEGVRRWHIRPFIEVDAGEGDVPGYIADGTHIDGNYAEYPAVPKNTTITPTTSSQTIGGANYMMEGPVTVAAMPSGTAGTPTATKGAVSNHSVSVTPSVTNTTGYITGSTKTGTAVTVSASELVSGSETKTANGTYDVTNLASLVVAVPIVTYYTGSSAPSSSLGSNGDIYLQTGS